MDKELALFLGLVFFLVTGLMVSEFYTKQQRMSACEKVATSGEDFRTCMSSSSFSIERRSNEGANDRGDDVEE